MATSRRSWLATVMVGASGLLTWGNACSRKDPEPVDKYGGPPMPEPPKYGGPPMPTGPAPAEGLWRAVASSGRSSPTALAAADQRLAALPTASKKEVIDVLNQMAAQEPTPAGVEAASKLAHDSNPGRIPAWAGSGTAPNTAALHDGGMAVLRGLIARTCDRSKTLETGKDLMKNIRQMPLPRFYTSGGLTDGFDDRLALQTELEAGLEKDTLNAVMDASGAWPNVKNPPYAPTPH